MKNWIKIWHLSRKKILTGSEYKILRAFNKRAFLENKLMWPTHKNENKKEFEARKENYVSLFKL